MEDATISRYSVHTENRCSARYDDDLGAILAQKCHLEFLGGSPSGHELPQPPGFGRVHEREDGLANDLLGWVAEHGLHRGARVSEVTAGVDFPDEIG